MNAKHSMAKLVLGLALSHGLLYGQQDIGSAFTYQGAIENGSGPVTDTCDFRFGLWNDSAAGAQVGGSPLTIGLVDVESGNFRTMLDFGAGAMNGDARWLEIEVQCPGDVGFTLLSPRVELTPTPHAVRAVEGVGPLNALEIDAANGRIGIGTSAPIQPLHIVGTVMAENPGSSPLGSTVRLGGPSGDPGLVMERGNGAGGVIKRYDIAVESDNSLEFRDTTVAVDRMVIDTTGRVGIGTNSPAEQLDVTGNIHASGILASGNSITIDGTAYTINSDADLEIHLADGRVMRFESDATAPNVIGGHPSNVVGVGVYGATIAGGGSELRRAEDLGYRCEGTDVECGACSISQSLCAFDTDCSKGEVCQPQPEECIGACERNLRIDCGGANSNGCGLCVGGTFPGSTCSFEFDCGIGGTCVPDPTQCNVGETCGPTSGANRVLSHWASIGGGQTNIAEGVLSHIGGGESNFASGETATISGGAGNWAGGTGSTVGGGSNNTASSIHTTVGGGLNNTASSLYSTVPGGRDNVADSLYSFAAGRRAKANHSGSFVWGDSNNSDVSSFGNNTFTARTSGGVAFYTNSGLTTGVAVPPGGGSWASISDRNVKRNIEPIDPHVILSQLTQLPLATWNYESQDESIRHIGPMAQDFHAAFAVGEDERYITGIDADGVALAAIQGLHQIVQEKDCEIEELKARLTRLEAMLNASHSLEKGRDR